MNYLELESVEITHNEIDLEIQEVRKGSVAGHESTPNGSERDCPQSSALMPYFLIFR